MESHKNNLITNFKAFLNNEISKEVLVENISKKFPIKGEGKKTYWWRYFKGDTGANDISSLRVSLDSGDNNWRYARECMQIAIDEPDGIEVILS